jgi:hypothetical protein
MAFAADEGTGGSFFLFEIFRFPTHTLFWEYFSSSSFLYRMGLFYNIIFYSILFERLTLYLRARTMRSQNEKVKQHANGL